MQRYNPFLSAIAQLYTPEAIAWYIDQAEAGAARHIGAVTSVFVVVYAMGAFTRQFLFDLETAATPSPECTAIVPVESASIVVEEPEDRIIDAEIIEEPLLLAGFTGFGGFTPRIEQVVVTGIREALERAIALEVNPQPLLPFRLEDGSEWEEPISTPLAKPTSKRKPRAKKASPAPQKAPTLARFGKHVAAIN